MRRCPTTTGGWISALAADERVRCECGVFVERASARALARARARIRRAHRRDVGGGTTRAFERIEGEAVAHRHLRRGERLDAQASLLRRCERSRAAAAIDRPASLDVTETYANDFVRGRDALFARSDVHFVVPGGAGLRGYSPLLRVDRVAALNGELATHAW